MPLHLRQDSIGLAWPPPPLPPAGAAAAPGGGLWRRGTVLSLRRGGGLGRFDTAAECALGVLSGTLRVCRPLVDGRRQITAFLLPGDWYGLDGSSNDHRAMVEAVTDAQVVRVSHRHLRRAGDQADAAVEEALRASLAAALTRVVVLGQKSARDKLAAFLLEMSGRAAAGGGGGGGTEVLLPMSRHDIADYLGLRPETVCRTFTQIAAAAVIALPEPQHVPILDRAALEAMGTWPC